MNVLEDLRRQTEVLCYDSLRCVLDPLVQEESRILGKVATVKDEQELGAILAQALERVWVAGWEIPQITLLQVVDERSTFSVECRDANLAFSMLADTLNTVSKLQLTRQDISPLSLFMPVELANNTRLQTHVHTCNLFRRRQFTDCCLSGPAALLDPNVRIRKAPM